jgi:tRNA(Arg) A34 adenosine deaminase TadA/predicted GNAT family acetyltransferase
LNERDFINSAVALAAEAAADGDVPVGAVVVRDNQIVGRGRNRRESQRNAVAHAEIEAITDACSTLGGWRLCGCTIYVTMKPCPMCEGAIVNARIGKTVVCETEASSILNEFFDKLRERRKMYSISFIEAKTDFQIERAAALADEIWHEWFPPIIGKAQTDYMVEKFQSYDAIKSQIETEHYEYYILQKNGIDVGYTAIAEKGDGKLFLSKAYIKSAYRGNGYFRELIALLSETAKKRGLTAIWLTVNKYNELAKTVYTKSGFTVIGEGITDIGSGYVMDDYYFELTV